MYQVEVLNVIYVSFILFEGIGKSILSIARPVNVHRLRRKFMENSIISPVLSLLMKHLVIGQRQKAPNFSAFHSSPYSNLVSIGQHFVTNRVGHLLKGTKQA